MNTRRQLKNGGDPRALADYAALRDEMMKLSHPARPDVNWKQAEILCLRLFEQNGVELQTAAWYTLARTHIAGMVGFNEGLALLNALVSYQWAVMWPGHSHARMEIIAGLSPRLQAVLRTFPLDARDELPALYQAEKGLNSFCEALVRHELKQASRMDGLLHQVKQAITRLENAPYEGQPEPTVVLPAQAVTAQPVTELSGHQPLVYVAQSLPEPPPPPEKRGYVWSFIGGASSALLVGGLLLWGWHHLHSPTAVEQQLVASITPLPELPRQAAQLNALREPGSLAQRQAGNLAQQNTTQLNWLMALPPAWALQYGQQLIAQSQTLWPSNPEAEQMQKAWQQQLEANALPLAALDNWHQGMVKLQQLTDRLNALDERKGKYMTGSELKTMVFAITQEFGKTVPMEEQLRQLATASTDNSLSGNVQSQAELRLAQLLNRYMLIKQQVGSR
ncbi:VasL domain-containing protein [Serratia sp. DD3]|uniref:VasL domain-containing protein n=1 Tax=Serratia sp. DD3 TaxID=1410619 RepID=UPI0003C52408|nr:VasL domain-containing protein [Serratia sp. DD3]KEY60410.1 type VI secretion-associated protein, family [Serratia sp. DD3]